MKEGSSDKHFYYGWGTQELFFYVLIDGIVSGRLKRQAQIFDRNTVVPMPVGTWKQHVPRAWFIADARGPLCISFPASNGMTTVTPTPAGASEWPEAALAGISRSAGSRKRGEWPNGARCRNQEYGSKVVRNYSVAILFRSGVIEQAPSNVRSIKTTVRHLRQQSVIDETKTLLFHSHLGSTTIFDCAAFVSLPMSGLCGLWRAFPRAWAQCAFRRVRSLPSFGISVAVQC